MRTKNLLTLIETCFFVPYRIKTPQCCDMVTHSAQIRSGQISGKKKFFHFMLLHTLLLVVEARENASDGR